MQETEEQAELFTEDFKFGNCIRFDGPTWMEWVREHVAFWPDIEVSPGYTRARDTEQCIHLDDEGDLLYYLRRFPAVDSRGMHNHLQIYQGKRTGMVEFSEDVVIPIVGRRPRMYDDSGVVMGLTPMEVCSMRGGWKRSKGHTLVAGLGLGTFAIKCLERKQVDKVTVVERNPRIIELFGKPLQERYGDRLEIIEANVYKHLLGEDVDLREAEKEAWAIGHWRMSKNDSTLDWSKAQEYDRLLFDIWDEVTGKCHDQLFQLLYLTRGSTSVWGWGYRRD